MAVYEDVVEQIHRTGHCCAEVNPREYHAWKKRLAEEFGCPVVSKSSLGDFSESPYRFRYNEQNGIRKESKGMRIGSMVDCKVLTPALWGEQYAEPWKPEGKYAEPWKPWEPQEEWKPKMKRDGTPGKQQDPDQKAAWDAAKEQDKLAKEAFEQEKAALKAAFEEDCERRGITVTKPEEVELADEIAAQATAHLEGMGLVRGESFVSQVAMWVYVDTIGGERLATPLIVTGMIDILPNGGTGIIDLKTTSEKVENTERLFYAVEDYHYGLQAALYVDLYNQCTGEQRDAFSFLFVTNTRPVMSCLVQLSPADVAVYRRDYELLLHRFARACAFDDWGEPSLEPVFYTPTYREGKRFARLMEGGAE